MYAGGAYDVGVRVNALLLASEAEELPYVGGFHASEVEEEVL